MIWTAAGVDVTMDSRGRVIPRSGQEPQQAMAC